MDMTVRQRADWIATLRHTAEHTMETLARWVPTTAEMEVKLLFGRHLWEFAQHADAFGKRTAALRVRIHTSREPVGPFVEHLELFAGVEDGPTRVAAVYDGLIPVLEGVYRHYVAQTDPLMDEPSVRIIERCLGDFERMRGERDALLEERPDLAGAEDGSIVGKIRSWSHDDPIVDFRPDPKASGDKT